MSDDVEIIQNRREPSFFPTRTTGDAHGLDEG